MAAVTDLIALLKKRVGFDVKDASESPTQLRLLGSVPLSKKESADWILVVHQLLTKMDGSTWTCDISKQYFLRAVKVWWGWRLIFQGTNLSDSYAAILAAVDETPPASKVELTQIALPGATAARAQRTNVGVYGSVAVGPRR